MHDSPWQNIIGSLIKDRVQKPRQTGLTMVIDTGIGINQLQDILELAGSILI